MCGTNVNTKTVRNKKSKTTLTSTTSQHEQTNEELKQNCNLFILYFSYFEVCVCVFSHLPAVDIQRCDPLNLFPKLNCLNAVPLDRKPPTMLALIHQVVTMHRRVKLIVYLEAFCPCIRCRRFAWISDEHDRFLQTSTQTPMKIQTIASRHVPFLWFVETDNRKIVQMRELSIRNIQHQINNKINYSKHANKQINKHGNGSRKINSR